MLKSPPRNLIWWTVTIHLYTLDVLNFQASILNCWPSTFNSYPRPGPSWPVLCANINILTLECGQKLTFGWPMFDLWSKCWKVWCQSIVKYTRLLFGVKIMWVAFSFFRMTLQKTDEKLQQNLERQVLVCQICYLGSSTYHQSFKGSDHGFISFLSLSYRSSNVGSSMWLPAFWEHGFLCCWLKILGKTSLKNTFSSEH